MQIKAILLFVVIGAVAVLAKKGSSEEDRNVMPILVNPNVDTQPMFVVLGAKGKKLSKGYPQGRPFQVQQQLDSRFPQMTSFYPQESGMQSPFGQQGSQKPFGQNSFSGYPFTSSQQYPASFNNPSNYPSTGYSNSQRPFYAGSGKPNQFNGNGRPNQFSGNTPFNENGRPSQFPGNSQFNGNGRPSQFPGSAQFSASSQFPGNGQPSFSAQFPGSTFLPLTS